MWARLGKYAGDRVGDGFVLCLWGAGCCAAMSGLSGVRCCGVLLFSRTSLWRWKLVTSVVFSMRGRGLGAVVVAGFGCVVRGAGWWGVGCVVVCGIPEVSVSSGGSLEGAEGFPCSSSWVLVVSSALCVGRGCWGSSCGDPGGVS